MALRAAVRSTTSRLARPPRPASGYRSYHRTLPPSFPSAQRPPLRIYRYVVDVHGQLFLHDTIPKNLTSCFKNDPFLDFFFRRLGPNPRSATSSDPLRIARHDIHSTSPTPSVDSEWREDARLLHPNGDKMQDPRTVAYDLANADGYEWISPCGPELNFVKTQDTPIVFRELSEQGTLRYAGGLEETFRPEMLLVDSTTGYLYHPSPNPSRSSNDGGGGMASRSRPFPSIHRYGRYSLLASNLVLQHFAQHLEIDPDRFHHGDAGSLLCRGTRYPLGLLPLSDSIKG